MNETIYGQSEALRALGGAMLQGGGVALASTLTQINLARVRQRHYLRGAEAAEERAREL